MITWLTVWVLTVYDAQYEKSVNYQLTYATRELCVKQKKFHETSTRVVRCNFQQVPVYVGGKL